MHRILVFAFRGNISSAVAKSIKTECDKLFLDSSTTAIDDFVTSESLKDYDYILGLGVYSRRDRGEIRIERVCSSSFRSKSIAVDSMQIPYFMHPAAGIKLASGIGNSWCNLVSFRLTNEAKVNRYSFLHVPKTFSVDLAAQIIDQQLKLLA